jgi:hypothetical protein
MDASRVRLAFFAVITLHTTSQLALSVAHCQSRATRSIRARSVIHLPGDLAGPWPLPGMLSLSFPGLGP